VSRIVLSRRQPHEEQVMPKVTATDGTRIFYKDWGTGRPVVFSHGWPLSADAWDPQLLSMASNGFRAVAHDRRGHGRSSQPWHGNTMDDYADDLAAVIQTLDLHDVVLVGHSTGDGEVVRYIGRHGSARVSKVALVAAIPPLMLETADNPAGTPIEVFDDLRAKLLADRSQLFTDLSAPFFGGNRPGSNVSQGVRDQIRLMSMQVGLTAAYDCIRQFSESGSCRTSGSPGSPPGCSARPARSPARRSRFTTRSWLPPRPNACGICWPTSKAGRHGIAPAGGFESSQPVARHQLIAPPDQRLSSGRHTRSRCAAPWWLVIDRILSPSSRTPGGCTPSTRSRSAPRPTAWAPSSLAMKPRPGRSRG
jgi:non-heme chloroperoxidase